MKIRNNWVSSDAVINMVNNHARRVEMLERPIPAKKRMEPPKRRIQICITGEDMLDVLKLICVTAIGFWILWLTI